MKMLFTLGRSNARLFLLLLSCFAASTLAAQSTPTPDTAASGQLSDRAPGQLRTLSRDELDIVKVLTAQERAWNAGDLDTFAQGYKNSPDILFVGTHISRGYAEMLDDYRHNYPNRDTMGQLGFSDLEPHLLDAHFAVVLGRYHLDRGKKFGGVADGVFSLVLEKTAAGWRIIVDHTS